MNDLIDALLGALRGGGIVIEKDGDNAVRIRLDEKPATQAAPADAVKERLNW